MRSKCHGRNLVANSFGQLIDVHSLVYFCGVGFLWLCVFFTAVVSAGSACGAGAGSALATCWVRLTVLLDAPG